MLTKEKAMLFKDYVQPYNFMSRSERPNTSNESIYGSTFNSTYPGTTKSVTDSTMVQTTPSKQSIVKRTYQPKQIERPVIVPKVVQTVEQARSLPESSDSSPETIHREPTKPKKTYFNDDKSPVNDNVLSMENHVMPSNLTEATSMEWDPFTDGGRKSGGGRRGKSIPLRRRNISPISEAEEDENNKSLTQPGTSLEAHQGSIYPASPVSSEMSYIESGSTTTRSGTGSETSELASPRTNGGSERLFSNSGTDRIYSTMSDISTDCSTCDDTTSAGLSASSKKDTSRRLSTSSIDTATANSTSNRDTTVASRYEPYTSTNLENDDDDNTSRLDGTSTSYDKSLSSYDPCEKR